MTSFPQKNTNEDFFIFLLQKPHKVNMTVVHTTIDLKCLLKQNNRQKKHLHFTHETRRSDGKAQRTSCITFTNCFHRVLTFINNISTFFKQQYFSLQKTQLGSCGIPLYLFVCLFKLQETPHIKWARRGGLYF